MNRINRKGIYVLPMLFAMLTSACDKQVYDDLEPCQTNYHLKFRYDYNIKFADAFPAEVNSVAVWAFDSNGKLAWQHKENIETLVKDQYRVDVSLPAGRYDFVTWCGLSSDSPFVVDSETPVTMSELGMTLTLPSLTKADDEIRVSDIALSGLYHSITRGINITANPNLESDNEIELSLTKDTNYFKIVLQNIDGTSMDENDFSFYITGGNTRLEHDNSYGESDEIHYQPWSVTTTEISFDGEDTSKETLSEISGIVAELHTSRLMADSKSLLIVRRNKDNKDIIRIPLVDYLLMVKGHYRDMTDQEYLDRQDEYNLTFFLDRNRNWYSNIGIYVNSWHVVPPQDEFLH